MILQSVYIIADKFKVYEVNSSGILAQECIINCIVIFLYNSARFTFSWKVDAVNSSRNLFENANLEVNVCYLTMFRPLLDCVCTHLLKLA